MGATRNAFLGGSPTQPRQVLDEQLSDQIGGQMAEALIETSLTGSPTSAGLGLMQRFLRNRQGLGFRGAREEAAREIAQLLATERPVDEVDQDRKSTRLNSSHSCAHRMQSSACKKKKN